MSWSRSGRRGLALAALSIACGPAASPPLLPEPGGTSGAPEAFSADAAWGHLTALAAVGARNAGTPGAEQAREYLVGALRQQGLEVEQQRAHSDTHPATVNLVARIEGASPDVILLVAPYDSPPGAAAGDLAGASGAALLVELARALGARRSAYTLWIALVEGDALAAAGAAPRSQVGTGALVAGLSGHEHLDRIRLAVYFGRVADPQLRIARDLMSLRSAREDFWIAARRLGQSAVFPPDAPLEAVESGDRALLDAGMRRTLAISASRLDAAGSSEGAAPPDDLEHASRESLGTVGTVSAQALTAISERLAKIDRFVKSPIGAGGDAPREAPAPRAPGDAPEVEAGTVPPPPEAPALPRADAGVPSGAAVEGDREPVDGVQVDGAR